MRPTGGGGGIDLSESEADGYMRTWTAPDLPNVEFLALLKVFPAFVVQNPLPRFPIPTPPELQLRDPEQGETELRDEIRVGTGSMWLGRSARSAGWHGGWWTRFKLWLKTIFC